MKKWSFRRPDPALTRALAAELGVSAATASLLVNRKVATADDARKFLDPDLGRLHSPFLLPDMEKAVRRTRRAIDGGEKILVYGDRDVDGVTSIALLVRALKSLGAEVFWTVPAGEGHGLSREVLQARRREGITLAITADCGTSAGAEIEFARSIGMDVIVTDHHLPPEDLPPAAAVVNPNLRGSAYPFKDLAGCLTAFKFALGLMMSFSRSFGREFVAVDLETTGLSAERDEIVEIGAVLVKNHVPLRTFHSLVRPEGPIPPQATQIHGITDDMVRGAPAVAEVLPKFLDFLGDRTVLAHNASFDLGFLRGACRKCLGRPFGPKVVDTLSLARETLRLPSHSLTFLVRELGIDRSQAHRSIDDCLAAARLFQIIEEKKDPRIRAFLEEHLDLLTLGTIADIVSLTGENRIIVRHGLPKLGATRKVGLRALLAETGLAPWRAPESSFNPAPTARDVAWGLTPILNAAGRFQKADVAVRLLLTENEGEAWALVRELSQLNRDRKTLQKANLSKFLDLAGRQCDLKTDQLIFIVAEGLEHGVTGIAASAVMREFGRPAVLLIVQDGMAVGSSRSVPDFNIVEALKSCEDLLVKYGGHPAAAGLTVETRNVEALRTRLKAFVASRLGPSALPPAIAIDLEVSRDAVTDSFLEEVRRLEPFGQGNPAPVLCLRGAIVKEISLMGPDRNHLKLVLEISGRNVKAVGWGMSGLKDAAGPGGTLDLAFELEFESRGKSQSPRFNLLDLCPAGPEELDLGWVGAARGNKT